MGGFISKSKTPKSKDPRWQGVGPNTPLPGSPNPNSNSYGGGQRSQTLASLDNQTNNANNNRNTRTPAAKGNKSSKIMLLLKLDPKGGGQRKIITKNLISLPSDFRHTGHIGAGEVRSGQVDTEKIKNQMMEVAACLKLDLNAPMPVLKTMPVQSEDRENVYNGPDQVDRYSTRPRAEAAAF
ncbi:hypothetical protein BGX21_001681 [Mortierella sp. AD011]|nr:hypothetical protein BGX20_000600 [Mortierella sp. AD010]KAF9382958.1 hypothetical protein BGX21_001681 [Mortierella sp. AD011]